MMAYESPIRDLSRKLRNLAREHLAYSQVADFIKHMDEHLSALAYAEEVNRRYTGDRDESNIAELYFECCGTDDLHEEHATDDVANRPRGH